MRLGIAAISLAVGSFIYLLFRSKTLLMFSWVESLGLAHVLDRCRNAVSDYSALVPSFVRWSLPDALWLFSLLLVVDLIWSGAPELGRRLIVISLAGALALELTQGAWPALGTFDWWDVIALGAASLGALWLHEISRTTGDATDDSQENGWKGGRDGRRVGSIRVDGCGIHGNLDG